MADPTPKVSPFNGPVECGMRALAMLWAERPSSLNIQRMVIYDYLLVHSGDVSANGVTAAEDGMGIPQSLHPATPNRGGEILVRRRSLSAGVQMLIQKGLAVPVFDRTGVSFAATDLADPFLDMLEAPYLRELRHRAEWVSARFRSASDKDLADYSSKYMRKWGSEFIRESVLREKS